MTLRIIDQYHNFPQSLNCLKKLLKIELCFLDNKKFFAQYGFLKGRSTATAVFDFVSKVQDSIDKKRLCGALFVDLTKAFDTINHHVLLNALFKANIKKKALKWLHSYLYNRSQCVKLSQISSSFLKLQYGVPQGLVLGPTLFLMAINSLALLKLCLLYTSPSPRD